MPFGKVISLLSVAFQRIFTQQKNVLNIATEDSSLLKAVGSTEEPSQIQFTQMDLNEEENNEEENSSVVKTQEDLLDVGRQSLENNAVSGLVTTGEDIGTPLPKILEARAMIQMTMLQDELQNFVFGSTEVQGAILASPDGLALASAIPSGMDEERTAAMSASMLSLGERIGRELVRGTVARIVVEGEKGYGVLVGCGAEAVLLVLASSAVKQGILFLEIKRAVNRIVPLLA